MTAKGNTWFESEAGLWNVFGGEFVGNPHLPYDLHTSRFLAASAKR